MIFECSAIILIILMLSVLILRSGGKSGWGIAVLPLVLVPAGHIAGNWLVAPIAMPGILTAMVLAFIGFWNEFYFASLFLRSRELMTLTVVLSQFSKGFMVDYTGLFASVIVIIAIPLVCYLSCSKFFISALSGGAVKG